jgi:tRNA (guanine37-N1)-methyltransferase
MVLKAEPLAQGGRRRKSPLAGGRADASDLSPRRARPFDQATAARLAGCPGFALVAGRYEGIDQRVSDALIDEELSIGDYVLSGGELPGAHRDRRGREAPPGALGDAASAAEDSFGDGLLDWPHYTRPEVWDWAAGAAGSARRQPRRDPPLAHDAGARTHLQRRPDLLGGRRLLSDERAMLEEYCKAAGVEPPR